MKKIKNLFSQREKKDFFVGIIGRPNVGKSTLFNTLIRKKKAFVKNDPGVTRDLLLESTNWWGHGFSLVDTGGLSQVSKISHKKKDSLSEKIRISVFSYLSDFDFLIFVLDSKAGLFLDERKILKELKMRKKPFITVINKVDNESQIERTLSEFYALGEELIPAAFEKKFGIEKIVSSIISEIQKKKNHTLENSQIQTQKKDKEMISLASTSISKTESSMKNSHFKNPSFSLVLTGKPNVGKSTLLNKILGFQRALVSEKEGTTLDCIKSQFEFNNYQYDLTDTAGIKPHAKNKTELETLSSFFSKKEIEMTDIVLLILDVLKKEVSRQDLKIAKLALEHKKALLLVANKMDQEKNLKLNKMPFSIRKSFKENIKKEFHFFPHIPLVFISAKTGLGLKKLFSTLEDISRQLTFKIPTSTLNTFFKSIFLKKPPSIPLKKGAFKFFYSTQTNQIPPSFMIFAKNSKNIPHHYKRFLEKSLQKKWNLQSVPMRLFFKEKT